MSAKRLSVGSDHAGFALKVELVRHLRALGYDVHDFGATSEESVDYPEYAHAVARDVVQHTGSLGILVCGSGNGVNITANKHAGVRSALAWLPEIARLARQHNDANVLALPARFLKVDEALGIVDAYLNSAFEGGRHARRVDAIETSVGTC